MAVRGLISPLAFVVGLALQSNQIAAQAPVDSALKKEVLGDGIYLFRAPEALDLWTSTNVLVVVNEQDVTVFDSNTRPGTTRRILEEIRKITDKPVRTLINSHWHMDHWSGNDQYAAAYPGLQIIATTETRDYMKRMGSRFFFDEVDEEVRPQRAALDSAIRTGKMHDGTRLTPAARRAQESDIADGERFAKEMGAIPRVLPTLVFRDTLIFWSGKREFRLFSETGDASGSAVMYLPQEKILVTGDVLVSPEDGNGPPPWTTNSYAITPWLQSLRSLEALDINVIVPGQGPAMRDKRYLTLTANLYAAIIAQVHSALEHGAVSLHDVQAAINVDSIGTQYTPGVAAGAPFHTFVKALSKKVFQESLDGISGDS